MLHIGLFNYFFLIIKNLTSHHKHLSSVPVLPVKRLHFSPECGSAKNLSIAVLPIVLDNHHLNNHFKLKLNTNKADLVFTVFHNFII